MAKIFRLVLCVTIPLIFTGCTTLRNAKPDGPPLNTVDINKISEPTPYPLAKSRYGNPSTYVVNGRRYHVLNTASGYDERGIASWYGRKFHGRSTSSGEPYNMYAMTAASRTLPIPVFARVTNLENGRSVIVKINDRGPFASNRIIDLSYVAARKLGYANKGTAMVEVKAIMFAGPNAPNNPIRFAQQSTPQRKRIQLTHEFIADRNPIRLAHGSIVRIDSAHVVHEPQLYLQVGAFRNHLHARQLQNRLKYLTHRPIMIQTLTYQHHAIYRVQIGPLAGTAETDKLHQLLKRLGVSQPIPIMS